MFCDRIVPTISPTEPLVGESGESSFKHDMVVSGETGACRGNGEHEESETFDLGSRDGTGLQTLADIAQVNHCGANVQDLPDLDPSLYRIWAPCSSRYSPTSSPSTLISFDSVTELSSDFEDGENCVDSEWSGCVGFVDNEDPSARRADPSARRQRIPR